MYSLSPEAEKAQQAGAARARAYWPRLARTSSLAVILRPLSGGRRYHRQFAQGVARALPQFKFNGKANRWEAPLDELEAAYKTLAPTVNVSPGALEILPEVL